MCNSMSQAVANLFHELKVVIAVSIKYGVIIYSCFFYFCTLQDKSPAKVRYGDFVFTMFGVIRVVTDFLKFAVIGSIEKHIFCGHEVGVVLGVGIFTGYKSLCLFPE